MPDEQGTQTLRMQGLVNVVVRTLLRTPGVSRGIGKYLITLHVVGRKSGKHYDVPVAYVPQDGDLLIGTPFAWARNLHTGDTVPVDYKGRKTTASVRVHTDEAEVIALYEVIARANHNFANFNKISLDAGGNPSAEDLRRCYRTGARVIRLTVR
jgi:deazaflavin-dependent oxidoreductase (nitroreductase family)